MTQATHDHRHYAWPLIMCLCGVDYFSTLGYQPSIAFEGAGTLAPLATLVLVLVTLFGALPIYRHVAGETPDGVGSIGMIERMFRGWGAKLVVLVLIGFAATDFVITKTLSAADAAAHLISNPLYGSHVPAWMQGQMAVTMFLLVMLGAMFLKGYGEVVGLATVLVIAFLGLSFVVVVAGLIYLVGHPTLLPHWMDEITSGRYHLAHASTKGSVELVRAAKERGIKVSAEVTPHHLLLTHEALLGYDTACKVNPPLREQSDVEALRQGLADGTIDCVATDHAPHSYLEKDVPFADASPGMVGLELCFPVLLDLVRQGCFSLGRLVDALTRSPSRIVALPAPTLREGAKANFVLVDPERKWTLDPARFESKSRNTPFAGREVKGRILATYVDGIAAFELPKEGTTP